MRGQVPRLHVARKVEAAFLQQSIGRVLQIAALMFLGAHIEQAHRHPLSAAQHPGHVQAAHMGKLQQHLRTAIHIGAGVDEHEGTVGGGHEGGQRRPGHTLDALDQEGGAHDESAGASGGNESIPFPRR